MIIDIKADFGGTKDVPLRKMGSCWNGKGCHGPSGELRISHKREYMVPARSDKSHIEKKTLQWGAMNLILIVY